MKESAMKINTNIKVLQARALRKQMTKAEIKLWQALRRKQLCHYRFRKQAPMGIYIVDFVCHATKVIIELDGGQHNEDSAIRYDMRRTLWLNHQGYIVQRFWNDDVLHRIESVLDTILHLCSVQVPPSFPSPARGEGTY